MMPIKLLVESIGSRYKAARVLGRKETQLKRWSDSGSMIDDSGQVWIKSGAPLDIRKL